MAGIRFTVAGMALYAWMRVTGVPSPTGREWKAASVLGALMFLIDYASLFWAEQRVPSGIAAVILAAIPVCITLLEIVFLRTQRLTIRLGLGLLVGVVGVAVLMNPSASAPSSATPHMSGCCITSHRQKSGLMPMSIQWSLSFWALQLAEKPLDDGLCWGWR